MVVGYEPGKYFSEKDEVSINIINDNGAFYSEMQNK